MIHREKCPLCSSCDIGIGMTCSDHFITGEEFRIAICNNCGFLFTQDIPAEEDIGHYYESNEYISHSDTSEGAINKLYLIARKFMLRRKREIAIKATGLKRGSLLDIGSGTGYFADEMKRAGWEVKGIEISEKARNFSTEAFGLDVKDPRDIASLGNNTFDCITLWHVMEHFYDPGKYIADISALLKQNGICIIALPNCCSYDAKHYREFWAAFDVPRHLWHFSPETFNKFAEHTGMEIIRLLVLPLDVFYISILSERYKGSAVPVLTGGIKGFWFALKTLSNRKESSSVIYILKKKI